MVNNYEDLDLIYQKILKSEKYLNKIKIKDNLFDYKNNSQNKPTNNNSFVVDLETFNGCNESDLPITTIIAFAHLSYLIKRERGRKPIGSFVEQFNPYTYDIINDTDSSLSYEDRENQLFLKALDTMIDITKRTSDSSKQRITLYMFNSAGYDNDYFLKILTKLGYTQTLDNEFRKELLNGEELKPLQKQYNDLVNNGADWQEIRKVEKQIYDKAKYGKEYLKHYMLLANDSVKKLSLKFIYRDFVFEVKDFCRFYQTNLKTLGKTVGIAKLTDIGDKYYTRDYRSLNAEEWKEYKYYAAVDIEVLWKAIKKYSGLLVLDQEKVNTISGLALHQWKDKEHFSKKYQKIDINYDCWDIGYASYRGGFSFVNEKHINKIIHNVNTYDINSSYPSSMLNPIAVEQVYDYEGKNDKRYIAELYWIEIKNFQLKDNMIPIIPYIAKDINNAYFKDYNEQKALAVSKHFKKAKEFKPLRMWVWKRELDWYEKYYEQFEYKVLEKRYFECKRIFNNYINHYYLTKAQADMDKLLCELLKNYLKHKDYNKTVKEMDNIFPKYFNDKNTLLASDTDYDTLARNLIKKEVAIIDKLDSTGLENYQTELTNQLVYLETLRTTTKLYLNTLYGKFGQHYELDSYYIVKDKYEKDTEFNVLVNPITDTRYRFKVNTVKQHSVLDNSVYSVLRIDKDKKKANNIFISSYIAMLSRCKMYEVIHRYGANKVLYGDTDSVKMIGELDSSYINNTELGKWKYEGTYETFAYIGSKKYIYRDTDNKFKFHIAGSNQVDTSEYPDYLNNKQSQDKMFKDFITMNLKIFKKATSTDKRTGAKLIGGKKQILLSEKDIEKTFISINERYEKIKDLKTNETLDYLLLEVEKEGE